MMVKWRENLRIKSYLWFFVVIFSISHTEAYIPQYSMILDHLAQSQGKGQYRIEQKVLFKHSTGAVSFIEVWWIDKKSNMRVDVRSSDQLVAESTMSFIYQNNKTKIFLDSKGNRQTRGIPLFHLERPFHLRNKEALNKLFSLWGITRSEDESKKSQGESDSFIQLVRRQGVVQYRMSDHKTNVLWIEQDEFVIRQWQCPPYGKMKVESYRPYPGSLFFPLKRTFWWKDLEVIITVTSVKRIKKWDSSLFTAKRLTPNKHLLLSDVSLDQENIREFYQQFR